MTSSQPPARPPSKNAGQMSEARKAAISNELSSLDLGMLASLNSKGASTDRVLRDGNVNMQLMNDAAASNNGAGKGKNGRRK